MISRFNHIPDQRKWLAPMFPWLVPERPDQRPKTWRPNLKVKIKVTALLHALFLHEGRLDNIIARICLEDMGFLSQSSMDSLRSSAGAAAGSCAGLRSSSGASPSHRVCTTPVCVARCSGSGRGSVKRSLEPLRAATVEARVDQGGETNYCHFARNKNNGGKICPKL